ncbi:MAG: right-handed parallel beta-helix repeat-containing protein [Phycisphaerales bacterium]|nr:right-handed parallel beta-helix repeat-containing protein [Phycisphaerales bacterium]
MSNAFYQPLPVTEFYVSPAGNDRWSGKKPSARKGRTDGPFKTIERAQKAVRALKKKGRLSTAVKVWLRGGLYELNKPLVFTSADSGTSRLKTERLQLPMTITYAAYQDEQPVISGGRRITGWKPARVNGCDAWVCTIPPVRQGKWNFTQLWVNGQRATRPCTDKKRLFQITQLLGKVCWEGTVWQMYDTGQDTFQFKQGDLQDWHNVQDVDFVALHFWIESRIPFAAINVKTHTARLQHKSRMRLTNDSGSEGAFYYVDNVFELLREPGQWYLDRPAGKLYYIPRAGETIETAEVVAPVLPRLAVFQGSEDAPIRHLNLQGLTFSHNQWVCGPEALTATRQAACHLGGAVAFFQAEHCAMQQCTVEHVDGYAIEINQNSFDVDILSSRVTDLAGGGIKIWHAASGHDRQMADGCQDITVADCQISDGGHYHHQAVGVLVGKCSGTQVIHNDIHHFNYTGISIGWQWGYEKGDSYGNVIEYNHVHHIGHGVLSDLGGIYALGVQPGTRIRYNIVHDVTSRTYGGSGIYTDEGSSNILIEGNLVYRTGTQPFTQHYGQSNMIRNNIFAFGGKTQVNRSVPGPGDDFTLTKNIIYFDNDSGVAIDGNWSKIRAVINRNLYFHRRKKPLVFDGGSLKQWQARGLDRDSTVADPLFVNPDKGDFRLKPNSPAIKMGFQPIDFSLVGPRPSPKRK